MRSAEVTNWEASKAALAVWAIASAPKDMVVSDCVVVWLGRDYTGEIPGSFRVRTILHFFVFPSVFTLTEARISVWDLAIPKIFQNMALQ